VKEIAGTLELIQYQLRNRRIIVECEVPPHVPPVHADRQQFRQVLLNLLTNASDAMPEGGTLTVRVTADTAVVIEIQIPGRGSRRNCWPG
jgi:signal transduction histidine kinase